VLEDNPDEIEKRENPLDVGFKVFKLDTTNLKKWETGTSADTEQGVQLELEERLKDMTNPVKEDRDAIDMIYEVMLKNGMDLSLPLEELILQEKKVFSIAENYLVACLEKDISLELIKDIANLEPKVVVFYDDGFADDVVKVNAVQQLEKQDIQVRVI
jgi:adenine-specific DNA-methyltransferase